MQFATGAAFAERAAVSDFADPQSAGVGLSGKSVVICTPAGFVVVKLDSDGNRLPEDSTFYPGCQWCQPFGGPAAIPDPEQPALALPASSRCGYGVIADQVPTRSGQANGFYSRAPPPSSFA